MNQALEDLGEQVAAALPDAVLRRELANDELTLWVERAEIVKVLSHLKSDQNCQFQVLLDVTAVDYPERETRFEVVYHLLSLKHNQRLRVKLETDEATPVPSATGVHNGANWFVPATRARIAIRDFMLRASTAPGMAWLLRGTVSGDSIVH